MNSYIREADPGFIFTPEVQNLFEFRKTYNDEAEIWLDPDNKRDDLGGYRIFEVTYLQSPGWIPMISKITFDGGLYVQSIDGVRINLSTQPILEAAMKALGIAFTGGLSAGGYALITAQEFCNYIINNMPESIRKKYLFDDIAAGNPLASQLAALIDKEGKQIVYGDIMTHIYNCLYNYFGPSTGTPVANPFSRHKKTYPTGMNVLTDINQNFNETVASYQFDNNYLSGIDAEGLYDLLNELKESDSDVNRIMQMDASRIFMTDSLGDKYRTFYICGYNIDQHTVYAFNETGDDQNYQVWITHVKSVRFSLNELGAYVKTNQYEDNRTYSFESKFFNHPHFGWYSVYGVSNDRYADVGGGVVIDSIGTLSQPKGITTNGHNITGRGLSVDYPDYIPSEYGYPVGKENPDNPLDYPYIRRGIPAPNVPIKFPAIPGLPPSKPIDWPSLPTLPSIDPTDTSIGSGLFTVYRLDNGDVLELGRWLWTENIIEEIQKIFKNNPMDSIMGFHQLYFDPEVRSGYTRNITLGFCDSGIAAPVVEKRYQVLDCGTVKIDRYFNDVRDYQTKISIYLPFIGITELDTAEVMDSNLKVQYIIDVLTGNVLVTLSVNRDGLSDNKVLYTLNGNSAIQMPLTSSDRSRMYANIASMAISGVAAVASGGMAVGSFAGAVANTLTSPNVSIQKSGSLSGSHGAMGFKKPYLIIERPIPFDAVDRGKYVGRPSNITSRLGNLHGYAEIVGTHIDTIATASSQERIEIEQLLANGVIL